MLVNEKFCMLTVEEIRSVDGEFRVERVGDLIDLQYRNHVSTKAFETASPRYVRRSPGSWLHARKPRQLIFPARAERETHTKAPRS